MTNLQTITAPAKAWISALSAISSAFRGKPATPILGNVLIDPKAGTLAAFDYAVSARIVLAEFDGGGTAFLAPYRWLLDAVRSVAGRERTAPVTVIIDGELVKVSARGYEVAATSGPLDEYPTIPSGLLENAATVDGSEFRSALTFALIAAERSGHLPVLGSVKIKLADGEVHLHATDRYRISSSRIAAKTTGTADFALPEVAARAWVKAIGKGGLLFGTTSDGAAVLQQDNLLLTALPVDGNYPDILSLFSQDAHRAGEYDRNVLLESATVAQRMGMRNSPAYVRLRDNGATVTFGGDVFEESTAPTAPGGFVQGHPDPIDVAFNVNYLLDALNLIHSERVRISHTNPHKGWTFTEGGVDAANRDAYRYMLMPVRMPRDS